MLQAQCFDQPLRSTKIIFCNDIGNNSIYEGNPSKIKEYLKESLHILSEQRAKTSKKRLPTTYTILQ